MTGFDRKVLHLFHESEAAVEVTIEVDFLGHGVWKKYEAVTVPRGEYKYHVFPPGFSAHWVRLSPSRACTATAEFMYT